MSKSWGCITAFAAVLVTAVMASTLGSLLVVFAVAGNTLVGAENISVQGMALGFSGAMLFVILGMGLGQIWSLPCAALIAVFEWPKAHWLAKRQGYFFAHVASSTLVAIMLSVVLPAINFFDDEFDLLLIVGGSWLVHTMIFAVGGISSAIAWWFLVISPARGAEIRSVERTEA